MKVGPGETATHLKNCVAIKRCLECGEEFMAEYPSQNLSHKNCGGKVVTVETFIPQGRRLSPKAMRNYLARQNISGLCDSYIKQLLGDRYASDELIEMKREQLLIHRATKQLLQSIKEKTNERASE